MSFFALLISLVGLRASEVCNLSRSLDASAADAALLLVLCDQALSLLAIGISRRKNNEQAFSYT